MINNLKTCIIVLNYNNWPDTIECLESLFKLEDNNYCIVVVDNNSTDNSIEKITGWINSELALDSKINKEVDLSNEHFANEHNNKVSYALPKLTIIESDNNNGYAGGNNKGIRYALKDITIKYIWLLNNDTIVDRQSLKELYSYCECNQKIGVCGSKIMYYHDPTRVQSMGGYYNRFFGNVIFNKKRENKNIDAVTGASLFITRDCILSIGLLPEEYFLYNEDVDYCLCAKKNGFGVDIALNSIVYHKVGSTTGGNEDYRKREELPDLLMIQNRLVLSRKYSSNSIGVYIGIYISIIRRIFRMQPNRAFKLFIYTIKNMARS